MARKFNITKSKAVELLVASGVVNAPNYTEARLCERLQRYDDIDESRRSAVKGSLARLRDSLELAITRGDLVVIAANGEASDKKKQSVRDVDTEPAPKKKEKKYKDDTNDHSAKKRDSVVKILHHEEATPKIESVPGRGVGIKEAIIEILSGASKAKPITKNKIIELVVKKYPERNPESLKQTVRYYVPGYLKRCGVNVRSSPDGWWIKKEKAE